MIRLMMTIPQSRRRLLPSLPTITNPAKEQRMMPRIRRRSKGLMPVCIPFRAASYTIRAAPPEHLGDSLLSSSKRGETDPDTEDEFDEDPDDEDPEDDEDDEFLGEDEGDADEHNAPTSNPGTLSA